MNRRVFLSAGSVATALAPFVFYGRSTGAGSAAGGSVRVSRFGFDGAALHRAIETAVPEVEIDVPITVDADVTLRSGQTLRFTTGRILVPPNATIVEAVLRTRGGRNIALIDPVVEVAVVTRNVAGISFVDTVDAGISGGRLTRASLRLEGNHDVPSRTNVSGTLIDLAGKGDTALYLSGVRDVTISNVTCRGGLEGVGIYNNARHITLRDCLAENHRRDGFVIMAGQRIAHIRCKAHDNGQSGFTTQRQAGGEDSRFATWIDCEAWSNSYDGFDIRGASGEPWQVNTGFVLKRCNAHNNAECGFYIVKAEGTRLEDCVATLNSQQNLFVDSSDRVTVRGFRSISGAARVLMGPNKAGILVYNSQNVHLFGPVSSNDQGMTQEFGISFTGNSRNALVSGGNFARNSAGARLGGDGATLVP